MGPFAIRQIVLLPFPFSDLTASKLRPALVLADSGKGDWVLCQITSNPYADPAAITLTDADFAHGSLQRVSEVIGPPAPQIVPKKHVALACRIWHGGTQHRQRPK